LSNRIRLHRLDETPIGWCRPEAVEALESSGSVAWANGKLYLTLPGVDISTPAPFEVGEAVWVILGGKELPGWIRAVIFAAGNVRYSVRVPVGAGDLNLTTLHRIEGQLLEPREAPSMRFDYDPYS